jgi:Fe-S-cluster containining protein
VLDYADYVDVRPTDTLLRKARLARRFVVTNAAGESHMRLDRDQQHCAALRGTLGRSVECSIYEDRPEVCRLMEPGSDRCLAARREKGVDPA